MFTRWYLDSCQFESPHFTFPSSFVGTSRPTSLRFCVYSSVDLLLGLLYFSLEVPRSDEGLSKGRGTDIRDDTGVSIPNLI